MMDAESDDPVEMIATLARSMMAEQARAVSRCGLRRRCSDCARGRSQIWATVTQHNDTTEPESKALPDQIPNQESDPFNLIESIAMEALSEPQARSRASQR